MSIFRVNAGADLVSTHHNFAMLQLLEPQLVDVGYFQDYMFEAVAALRNTPDYFRAGLKSRDAADTALRAWVKDWLTIPVCHLFYMPMSAYLQLMNVTVILLRRSRVALLADINTNGAPLTTTEDDLMLDLLERLASRLEEGRREMAAAHCSEWANDYLDLVAWKLRERKTCIERWIKIIANETGTGHREQGREEGDLAAFQNINMDEPSMWLDSVEALLVGDPYESWL